MYLNKTLAEILTISTFIRALDAESPQETIRDTLYKEILTKIYRLADDYRSHENLENAVEAFNRDTSFKINSLKAHYTTAQDLPKGWSSLEKKPDEISISKIFIHTYLCPNPLPWSFDLLTSLSGTHLFHSLQLKHSQTIQVLGLGKYENQQNPYILVAESHSRGERLSSYYTKALKGENSPISEGKEKAIHLTKKVSLALVELHKKKTGETRVWPNIKTSKLKNFVEQLLSYIRHKATDIHIQKIEDYASSCINDASTEPYQMSYTHGDISFTNLLYNEQKDSLCFIDLSTASNSIDREGNPIGYPPYDYCSFEFELLLRLSSHGIDPNIISELVSTFENSYSSLGGTLPNPKHHRWNMFYISCSRLRQVMRFCNDKPPEKGRGYYKAYSFLIEYLQKTLSS